MKRHTCIVCGKKRYERFMSKTDVINSRGHWACTILNYKGNFSDVLNYNTCSDKLSDLNGQLLQLRNKDLFKKMFKST